MVNAPRLVCVTVAALALTMLVGMNPAAAEESEIIGRMSLGDEGPSIGAEVDRADVESADPTAEALSSSFSERIARTGTVESDVAAAPTVDFYTWNECIAKAPRAQFYLRNRVSACLSVPFNYFFYRCQGVKCTAIGKYSSRLVALGVGVNGRQFTDWSVRFVRWTKEGVTQPTARVEIDVRCPGTDSSSACKRVGSSKLLTIAQWQTLKPTVSISLDASSATSVEGDGLHREADNLHYHEARIELTDPDKPGSPIFVDEDFRCDAATYVGRKRGCVFDRAAATLVYNSSDPSIASVAQHIQLAQTSPKSTIPFRGADGIAIPGGKASGKPLTRLYPPYADSRYKANRAVAKAACREHSALWGTPGLQCDEYPFASTYEGAQYTVLNPSAIWKFSVRMLDGTENGRAGTYLSIFMGQQRIVHGDTYWVEVS